MVKNEALRQGLNPHIAMAIVSVESNWNPKAIGPIGELGLFQLRVRRFKEKYLRPEFNIREGIRRLRYWREHCPLQEGLTWTICYNNGYRKPKYPYLHPYYKRIMAML